MFEIITSSTTNPSSWIGYANLTTTLPSTSTTSSAVNFTATEMWNASDVVGGGEESFDSELSNACHPFNPNFNCSVEDFLSFRLGAKQMPLDTAIWITILFVGVFVTGILGNLIVCFVIVKNASMHTATNYYLFSLAVSDLIFLLMGLPHDISLYWHQYPYNLGLTFCKMRALISEASSYVSVLTIVAFSMERFLAICHPLHLYTMSGLQRAVRIIAVLWVVSFLSAVPFAVFTKIHYLEYPLTNQSIPDSAFCAMLDNPASFPLWEVSTCVFFAFPMVIMVILYGRMGLKIRSRTRHSAALGLQQGSIHGESKQTQSRKAIIRMLAAVVITFFFCWAPFHAQRLLYLYGQQHKSFNSLNQWLFPLSGWLYYISCTINPILYNVMSHRYRIAFRETLCSRKRGFYSGANGFARDQSSFRETTVGQTGHSTYEGSQLLRTKSMLANRCSKYRDHARLSNSSVRWKENNAKRVDSVKSTDSTSSQSGNGNSNVIVVCIGNSFKTKCFTTANTSSSTTTLTTSSTSPTIVTSLSSNHNNNNNNSSSNNNKMTNNCNNFNHNNSHESTILVSRNDSQIENLLEEDEGIEDEQIDSKDMHETHPSPRNEFFFGVNSERVNNENNNNILNGAAKHEQPQNLLINCLSDLKGETCI